MSKDVSLKEAVPLLIKTYSRWADHNAPRLGASVAFYSILSFAPVLVLMTSIVGIAFGRESAHGALVSEARQIIGDWGADTVHSLLKNAQKPASGIFASLVAFITLLFGASGVFMELHDALNIMWDAPKPKTSGFLGTIRQRLFSFGMVLSVGFLLLVSLILSSALAYLAHSFGGLLPLPPLVLEVLNFASSFVIETLLFALMFMYVPIVHVAWREVVLGAVGTALLFTGGKFLLSFYLAKVSVGSAYGAAGSLVAVVIWIYYSAQIFFFGAEFTRVYAEMQRGKTVPTVHRQREEQTVATSQRLQAVELLTRKPSSVAGPCAFRTREPIQVPPISPSQLLSSSRVAPGEPARADGDIPFVSPKSLPREAKPRLLAALAIGFLLGRLSYTTRRARS
jgi:membrane protein